MHVLVCIVLNAYHVEKLLRASVCGVWKMFECHIHKNVITMNKNEVYLYFTYDITIKTLSSLDECIFLSCVDVISNETKFSWNMESKLNMFRIDVF